MLSKPDWIEVEEVGNILEQETRRQILSARAKRIEDKTELIAKAKNLILKDMTDNEYGLFLEEVRKVMLDDGSFYDA